MKKIFLLIVLIIMANVLPADLYTWSVWETAGRITWTPGYSYNHDMAIDSNDNLYLVWQDDSPGHFEIYFKRSTDGGYNWTGAQRLTWSSGGFVNPDIAIDSNNTIYVVMLVTYVRICYKKSTDGGLSWSSPQIIAWDRGSPPSLPSLAIDSNDTIHIVWPDGGGAGEDWITYKKSTDYGATWSLPKRILYKWWGNDWMQKAGIQVAANNTLHVVARYGTESTDFYYKSSTDGGTTWPITQRLTWNTGSQWVHALSIDSNNTIHLVWDCVYNDDDYRVYYKKSIDGGVTWSAKKTLTWPGSSFVPDLDIDSNDDIHVVFSHKESTWDYWELYYKRSTDIGTTWTPMQRITWRSPGETHDSAGAKIVIDSNDDVHVVWTRSGELYYGKMK